MQESDIKNDLEGSGFYEVHDFFLKTGIWTSNKPYAAMAGVYKHLTGHILKTSCAACIETAAKLINQKYPK